MRLRRLATKAHEHDNAQGSTKRERRMGCVGEAGVPARLAHLPELGLRDAQALLSRFAYNITLVYLARALSHALQTLI